MTGHSSCTAAFLKGEPALLKLRDGTSFSGRLLFPAPACVGELVFHTGMSGYQEILTDPSYSHQIITFTYPHIGNTGVNSEDMEATQVHASAMLVRCPIEAPSNYRATQGLYEWLEAQRVPVLAEVDTRAITHRLRDKGAVDAAIVALGDAPQRAAAQADELLSGFSGLTNSDLAHMVTRSVEENWSQTGWRYPNGYATNTSGPLVVVLDFGVKHNILRMLAEYGLQPLVLPANANAEQILAQKPHGVLLANGPGDPAPLNYAISTIKQLVDSGLPLFGICLGFQLLALALGATTLKMKFGHHGANHPVQDVSSKRVYITSQNHGFMVNLNSLPPSMQVTHLSLFDGSLQGFRLADKPVFALQGHPEASPGPHDINHLFATFAERVQAHAKA